MLKTISFPREFGMFFSSCESSVWIHTANIWKRSAQNNTALQKQLTQYHWYHRRNRHVALVRATVIQHPPFQWARFASGMERDCSDPSRSIRHQEFFEPQPGNFDWMESVPELWTQKRFSLWPSTVRGVLLASSALFWRSLQLSR